MIIDAHAHACGELHDIDGVLKYLANNQLDKIVLCPGEPEQVKNRKIPMFSNVIHDSGLGYGFNKVIRFATSISGVAKHIDKQNQIIARFAGDYPDKIMQAYWINPLEDDCVQRLKINYESHHFHVLKMHQCWHNFDITQDNIVSMIKWASSVQVPIFIHLLSRGQSVKFAKLTNRFTESVFIVGHMIGFEDIVANSTSRNVYFDISAPYLIPYKTLKNAVHMVGSNRLILGSDTPYGENNIRVNIGRIGNLGLTAKEQGNIMGDNFMRLLQKTNLE